jgi:LmbE family N-acetylglucosaminyl deacetylase
MYQHIYLSPHYDDAALSCGGAIHRQTQAGEAVLVVTICAAPPPPDSPLSPFAQELHTKWGDPGDVIATRQTEDQVSMGILGADYLRLSFADCIYRGAPEKEEWFYKSNIEIFGEIHPTDLPLADEIATAIIEQISPEANTVLYAPLTAGHHVDHQLTHTAAWQLWQQGWNTVFYEDYPYVDSERFVHSNLDVVLTRLRQSNKHLKPQLQIFLEENMLAKIDSIHAYASQLKTLFNSEAEMARRIRSYAGQVGEGQFAERIWLTV